MNTSILKKMPVKTHAYTELSYYTCRCLCGVRFFGSKNDNECPVCRYHANKTLAK